MSKAFYIFSYGTTILVKTIGKEHFSLVNEKGNVKSVLRKKNKKWKLTGKWEKMLNLNGHMNSNRVIKYIHNGRIIHYSTALKELVREVNKMQVINLLLNS